MIIHRILKLSLLAVVGNILLLSCQIDNKENQLVEHHDVFEVRHPDYELSPSTGMNRKHWVDAAEYLLTGAFSYIQELDDPMQFPKQPGKTYPNNDKQVPTEKLEGLCRTLFVAAPLVKVKPELELNGIQVAEYYRHQILNLINQDSPSYIVPRTKDQGPTQNLVEFGALAISLFVAPEVLWDPLSQDQKDALANTMLSYGDGPTVSSNWRYFNIFILSFFKDQGYQVNESLLKEYLLKSLDQYRGFGWYNDSPAYDYYSMWAFQLYSILWVDLFGNRYYKEIAQQLIQNFQDLNYNYPYMFSQDGKMMMYGRSISYRFGSISPFPFMGKYGGEQTNLGWLRKISSSTLLQFLQNENFLRDSVPTLGFYGAYEPAVQIYSCRGSVYWMGKAFLGLLLPEDDPFWTVKENDGPWKNYDKKTVVNKFAVGSNVLITNYPEIGASEIRAWCHEKVKDDWQLFRSTENYNRLSYSSIFPWQVDGPDGEIAMNYGFLNAEDKWEVLRLYAFKKFDNGAYYRDAVLETNENIKMNLIDLPISNGILRVDRNISSEDIDMRLGHYALPELNTAVRSTKMIADNYEATILDNGEYQLAIIPVTGWKDTEIVSCDGLHPVSERSTILTLCSDYKTKNPQAYYISLLLWSKSGEKWTEDALMPINHIKCHSDKVLIEFKDKTIVELDFPENDN